MQRQKRKRLLMTQNIALWCNGSTPDSGSVCESSSLSKATQISFRLQKKSGKKPLFFYHLFIFFLSIFFLYIFFGVDFHGDAGAQPISQCAGVCVTGLLEKQDARRVGARYFRP